MIYKSIRADRFLSCLSWKDTKRALVEDEDILMVLFVSHRWDTPLLSDKDFKKFKAIKQILNGVELAIKCYFAIDKGNHLDYISSLRDNGVVWYIILASRFISIVEAKGIDYIDIINNPLKYIGVWYDEACLDQYSFVDKKSAIFYEELKELPNFILSPKLSLLAILQDGDSYEDRAWCMLEYMVATNNKNYFTPLVYRTDIENSISSISGYSLDEIDRLWKSDSKDIVYKIWNTIFLMGSIVWDKSQNINEGPIFSLKANLFEFVVREMALFEVERREHNNEFEILKKLYRNSNLKTTIESDGFYLYLLILINGTTKSSEFNKIVEKSLNYYIESFR